MPAPSPSHVMRDELHHVRYLGSVMVEPRMIMGANSRAAVLIMALPAGSVTTESKGVALEMDV